MRILAMYLPQFHEIEENNKWWGKGYTEWNAVRNAKSYYKWHREPRVPLNNNYYDLSDKSGSVWKWQADLAKEYGVYGFCIYHYWFQTGRQLLEKPMEILLAHPEIDIKYCICWANETWKRTWYGLSREILMEQIYGGEEEWANHFYYLLPFFRDERYIKVDNKPLVNIYRTFEIDQLAGMKRVWNILAKQNGFDGVYLVAGNTGAKRDSRSNLFEAYYNYEPGNTIAHIENYYTAPSTRVKRKVRKLLNVASKKKHVWHIVDAEHFYKHTTEMTELYGKKCFLGTFAAYDDTPRRQYEGTIVKSSPNQFYENLIAIKNKLHSLGRDDDFVYVTAWNEWGEGAYLEPDTQYKYEWLEAIKRAH